MNFRNIAPLMVVPHRKIDVDEEIKRSTRDSVREVETSNLLVIGENTAKKKAQGCVNNLPIIVYVEWNGRESKRRKRLDCNSDDMFNTIVSFACICYVSVCIWGIKYYYYYYYGAVLLHIFRCEMQ